MTSSPDDPDFDLIAHLSDFLDRGESPPDELLNTTPDHRLAYDALTRFRSMAQDILAEEVSELSADADSWVAGILKSIHRESRVGRTIPVSHPSPKAALSLTEGAVRGLIRAAGDAVAGTFIGSCTLDGDVAVPGSPITVNVEASVFWGERMPQTAKRLRDAITTSLLHHTELNIQAVNVTITDVHLRRNATPAD
ncbi:Asp23/Gls24 family envelope stress response protein [Cryobacterium sp. 1639]|uniref:Asp23/Gls24 family envelope stress response protein n=1 Tax=Cryobacterium inferilacus TaxID=2866629 RepID=UPI001C73CB3C|nr:Asp23/Gls24 family envelope stress response protein [Cryobacterium sp. 1639]MBX0300542.1 Asp23/Gls24 family envelope stress response protein [Cryobacterium sp. 1639]